MIVFSSPPSKVNLKTSLVPSNIVKGGAISGTWQISRISYRYGGYIPGGPINGVRCARPDVAIMDGGLSDAGNW